jgi:hypothetical protein
LSRLPFQLRRRLSLRGRELEGGRLGEWGDGEGGGGWGGWKRGWGGWEVKGVECRVEYRRVGDLPLELRHRSLLGRELQRGRLKVSWAVHSMGVGRLKEWEDVGGQRGRVVVA